MAKRKITGAAQATAINEQDDVLVDITEVKQSAENFFEKNQKIILGALVGALVIFGGYFGYKNFVQQPRQANAVKQMWMAEAQFERDSFDLALNNPGGGYDGFLQIINKYGGSPAANAAKYYAGVSYLNLGKFEEAVKYLNDFSPSGELLPISKYGALGDAYAELGKLDEASNCYQKASKAGDNSILTPFYLKKLGLLYEKQGKMSDAQKTYAQIKEEYSQSIEGNDIEKYLVRASASK